MKCLADKMWQYKNSNSSKKHDPLTDDWPWSSVAIINMTHLTMIGCDL